MTAFRLWKVLRQKVATHERRKIGRPVCALALRRALEREEGFRRPASCRFRCRRCRPYSHRRSTQSRARRLASPRHLLPEWTRAKCRARWCLRRSRLKVKRVRHRRVRGNTFWCGKRNVEVTDGVVIFFRACGAVDVVHIPCCIDGDARRDVYERVVVGACARNGHVFQFRRRC